MLKPNWFSDTPIELVQSFELDIIEIIHLCEKISRNRLSSQQIRDINGKILCDQILDYLSLQGAISKDERQWVLRLVIEKCNSDEHYWWWYMFVFLESLYLQGFLNHNKVLFDRVWVIIIKFFISENKSYALEITEHREKVFWEEKNYFTQAQEGIFERTKDILIIITLSRHTNLKDATKDLLDQLVTVWILTRDVSLSFYDNLDDTEHTTYEILYEALIKWTYNDCPLKNQVLWIVFRYFKLHEDDERCWEIHSLYYWENDDLDGST